MGSWAGGAVFGWGLQHGHARSVRCDERHVAGCACDTRVTYVCAFVCGASCTSGTWAHPAHVAAATIRLSGCHSTCPLPPPPVPANTRRLPNTHLRGRLPPGRGSPPAHRAAVPLGARCPAPRAPLPGPAPRPSAPRSTRLTAASP
eukprot:355375-Chlamydomonas_euryale.AAC.2